MAERREDAAPCLHLQIARAPDVAHARVDREHRVVLGKVAQRRRDHLGPQAVAAALMLDVGLQVLDGVPVMIDHRVEEAAVRARLEAREQCAERFADVADETKFDIRPSPEMERLLVDLDHRRHRLQKCPIGEVRAEQDQQVAVGQRGLRTPQPSRPVMPTAAGLSCSSTSLPR